jgi:hypothetical protein
MRCSDRRPYGHYYNQLGAYNYVQQGFREVTGLRPDNLPLV